MDEMGERGKMEVGIAKVVNPRVSFFFSAFVLGSLSIGKFWGGEERSPASGRVSDHVITTHANPISNTSYIYVYNLGSCQCFLWTQG
jgi:hypothetical protein